MAAETVRRTVRSSGRRLLFASAVLSGWLVVPQRIESADWMFRRSYYSHRLPPEVARQYPRPQSRSAYRPAIAGTTPGFAIRGGYRYNRINLGSTLGTDTTILRENWYELEP